MILTKSILVGTVSGFVSALSILFAAQAFPNQEQEQLNELLYQSMKYGNSEAIPLLAALGADIRGYGTRSMHIPAAKGHTEVVGALLDNGADIKGADTAVLVASFRDQYVTLQYLFDRGAAINPESREILRDRQFGPQDAKTWNVICTYLDDQGDRMDPFLKPLQLERCAL